MCLVLQQFLSRWSSMHQLSTAAGERVLSGRFRVRCSNSTLADWPMAISTPPQPASWSSISSLILSAIVATRKTHFWQAAHSYTRGRVFSRHAWRPPHRHRQIRRASGAPPNVRYTSPRSQTRQQTLAAQPLIPLWSTGLCYPEGSFFPSGERGRCAPERSAPIEFPCRLVRDGPRT
jgi:hypothetical protein